ncbi:glycosyltransferase [Brachybacterium muris]|uniref:glycosyltransferase n=1 Tax=Brachybacterium muris TaxID=219301 RepID=UPI00223B35AC|nr:glycosyltransferase [Brachybacterium muris]MCT1654784.1 glycosyltransferase [Brachybacterium muris]MCT2177307.1 glycosyltransferase [Brachybacterium muris]
MRIALICHPHHAIREPWAGGMEMHTAMITRVLQQRGHENTVYAKEGSELAAGASLVPIETAEHEYQLNPDPERGAQQVQWSEEAIRRACALVAEGDADLVLNNSLSALPHELLAERRLITLMHSPVPVPAFMDYFERTATLPERHRFVTVSESNAAAWREHHDDVGVLPNGIDIDFWGPAIDPSPSKDPRSDRPVALWTGRITHQKGLHIALAAADLADVSLRISGLCSDPGYFEEKVVPHLRIDGERAGSEKDSMGAVYLGHLSHEDIRRELAGADVFIASPLWAEPFGLAPVEAMATGTPVAATPRGAMPEVIGDGGVVAASAAPEDLADAIRRALTIDAAKARANASRYSLDAMAERFEDLVRAIP